MVHFRSPDFTFPDGFTSLDPFLVRSNHDEAINRWELIRPPRASIAQIVLCPFFAEIDSATRAEISDIAATSTRNLPRGDQREQESESCTGVLSCWGRIGPRVGQPELCV